MLSNLVNSVDTAFPYINIRTGNENPTRLGDIIGGIWKTGGDMCLCSDWKRENYSLQKKEEKHEYRECNYNKLYIHIYRKWFGISDFIINNKFEATNKKIYYR